MILPASFLSDVANAKKSRALASGAKGQFYTNQPRQGVPRPRMGRHVVVNMHREFALVSVMHKRATCGRRLSVTAVQGKF